MQFQTGMTNAPPQKMKYIYWAFVHANWGYLYAGHMVIQQRTHEMTPPAMMLPVLAGLALAVSIALYTNFKTKPFLLNIFYKAPKGPSIAAPEDMALVYGIVIWAFCEAVSIYGLVWIMLGGEVPVQIAFTVLSLLCFWLANPKAILEQISVRSGS